MQIGKTLLKGCILIFGSLPIRVHHALSHFIGFLARKVVRYRVDVVRGNLLRAFPDKTDAERRQIEKKFYVHFGDIVTEAVWFGACRSPKRLLKAKLVRVEGLDRISALAEKSGSVMTMYSHTGNWEILGAAPLFAGYRNQEYGFPAVENCPFNYNNCAVVYKKLTSAVWDDLMKENRWAPVPEKNYEEDYIETNSLIRYVISHRAENKYYFVNTDQRPYRSAKGSVPVNFLGIECTTMAAAAGLAAKCGQAVCYMGMRRQGRGYVVEFTPICEDASKMPVEEIMQKYYDLLTADIQAQPWNYLWTHRRWAV